MIFTIKSLIVPTLRVGGRGDDAAWARAAARAAPIANTFICARVYTSICANIQTSRRAMVTTRYAGVLTFAALLSLPYSASAQAPAPAAAPAADTKPNDYTNEANWLCRPGRKGDACDVDLTTTVVAADGTLTRETWTANPKAPIDCFYVYPTVS